MRIILDLSQELERELSLVPKMCDPHDGKQYTETANFRVTFQDE
jgi:hypothetical protein